jgi:hypothetical protein
MMTDGTGRQPALNAVPMLCSDDSDIMRVAEGCGLIGGAVR